MHIERFSAEDMFMVKGTLIARIRRADSDRFELIWEKPVKNKIVNNGLAQLALLWGDAAGVPFTQGRIGTGTTAPANDDSALETQVDSQTGVFSRVTTSVTNDTSQLVSEHTTPGGGWNITEYGAFNSGAVMYNRVTFSAIVLSENDVLEMTYKAQMTRV